MSIRFNNRHHLTLIAWLLACACLQPLQAEPVYEYEEDPVNSKIIPVAADLSADARLAAPQGIPIMIAFSTPWCEYCVALEKNVLEPALVDNTFAGQVLIRKLEVADYNQLVDFEGRRVPANEFGHAAGIELYPTLAFYDSQGREVAPRIIGITVMDFVPQKIARAVQTAARAIRNSP